MSGRIEIARFLHVAPLEACTQVLTAADIPYFLSDDSLTTDMALVQRGSNPSCIVTVAADQVVPARTALLDSARNEVAAGIDPAHYLNSCDNDALLEVVNSPQESSEYDLAVAEQLLLDRGVKPPEIRFQPPVPAAEALAASIANETPLPGMKQGSTAVLAAGFLFTLAAGIWGLVIGWGYALGTETGADGRKHYVYDERTRKKGAVLLVFSTVVLLAWIAVLVNRRFASLSR